MNDEKIKFQDKFVTNKVILEKVNKGHSQELFDMLMKNKDFIQRWQTWLKDGYSLDDAYSYADFVEQEWQTGKGYAYAIINKQDGRLIGAISLVRRKADVYSFGYWLDQDMNGQGLTSHCVQIIKDYLLDTMKAVRVDLWTKVDNIGSMKVALKNGFLFEGTRLMAENDAVATDSKYTDVNTFVWLSDENKMARLKNNQSQLKQIFDFAIKD